MTQRPIARRRADTRGLTHEPLRVHERDGEDHHRHRLMQQRQCERRLVEERRNPERRLKGDGGRQRERGRQRAPSPQRARDVDGVQQRGGFQRVGHHAVIELHRERVLEQVAPERGIEEQARGGRHEAAVDQRPGVVDQSGAQAGNERAEVDLDDDEDEDRQRAGPNARRDDDGRPWPEALRRPDDSGEDHTGERQVKRQAILRHAHALGEARRDHPPADRTERRAESENRPQPRAQRRLDPPAPEKPDKRNEEHAADEPRQQPVRPFPPIDRLELVEAHPGMALAVLRDGLVLVELGLPCAGVEWRHDAGHRLPFDDRQARLGEAGCPAHRERHEHQGCHRQQPKPEGAAAGLGTRSKAGHAITSCDHWVAGGDADHIVVRALPQLSEPMPIRLRKLIGAIMLIVLVVTWALLAMALAQSPLVKANGAIEVIYYVVAGLAWVLPAMPLILWMSRPA